MDAPELLSSVMRKGVWHCCLRAGAAAPEVEVVHLGQRLEGLVLTADPVPGEWHVAQPIPPEVFDDGAHVLVLRDAARSTVTIGHLAIIAGQAADGDVGAELALLRAELDMLRSAFRQHCVETGEGQDRS